MEMLPYIKIYKLHDGQPVVGVSGDLSQPATTIFSNEQSASKCFAYITQLRKRILFCYRSARHDVEGPGIMFEIGDVGERTHGANGQR
jgi:hypothetical protein